MCRKFYVTKPDGGIDEISIVSIRKGRVFVVMEDDEIVSDELGNEKWEAVENAQERDGVMGVRATGLGGYLTGRPGRG